MKNLKLNLLSDSEMEKREQEAAKGGINDKDEQDCQCASSESNGDTFDGMLVEGPFPRY